MASKTDTAPILIVDDHPEIRAVLRAGLEAEGYLVVEAADRKEMYQRLAETPVSLVTLDIVLDDADGLELAREVRARYNVAIIMVTGRSDPFDRVLGLENGADDYIVKPFHIREVIVRIQNALRRYELEVRQHSSGRKLALDCGVLDTARRELQRDDGSLVDLTEMEFRLLELFAGYPERVLSRDDISQALRGQDWSPEDRTIDGHIARLRRKIETGGEVPHLIKTVRGVGYFFTGKVTPV